MKVAVFYAFLSSLVASYASERVKVSPIVHYKGNTHLRGTSSVESTIGVDKKGFITLPEITQTSKSIEIQFFDDEEAHIFDNVNFWDTAYGFTWHGKDEENGSSLIISVQINGENKRTYSGSASFGGEIYNFESLADGKIQVVETNFMSFPSGIYESKYEEPVELEVDEHNDERRLEQGDSRVVDVMCLYTPQALCAVNGQRRGCNLNKTEFINRMKGKCELAIDETNVAFQESGIHASANLVHSGLISEDYEEEEYMCDALNMFRYSDTAAYRAVRDLREQYAADLVTVIASDVIVDHNGEDRQICGCGDLFNSQSMAAFSVVHNQCATGYYSTAHELGHNLGCSHEPSSQSTDAGYGYMDPDSKFRTIMAYNCPGGCERILRFSNKSLQYEISPGDFRPMGSNNRSCANEINKNIARVASFREREEESNTADKSVSHVTESVSASPVAMDCTGWNEVKLEIDITTAMNNNPKHIKWALKDTKTKNKFESEEMKHNGATYTTRICIESGSTYTIDIEGFSSLESYSINVEGHIESSGTGNSEGSKSIEIDIDSIDLKHDGKSCTWLQNLNFRKQGKKCSREEDLQSICPKTCKAALQ